MQRRTIVLAFLALAAGTPACAFKHFAPVFGDPMINGSSVSRPFEELGLIHVEKWTVTVLYYFPLSGDFDDAMKLLRKEANALGADAVINVRVIVETNTSGKPIFLGAKLPYYVPILVGWKEYHASGMAIRYK